MSDERIFSGLPPDCPSELVLDRLVASELEPSAEAPTRAHVAGCERCQSRVSLREQGFEALPPLQAGSVLQAIHQSQEAKPSFWTKVIASLKRPMIMVPLAAAPLAVLFVVATQPTDQVMRKGNIKLRTFRSRGGQIEEVVSGERLRAGDRLRFKVTTPDPSNILLVSVEDSGKKTTIFPKVGAVRSGPAAIDSDGALRGAVKLDDYAGEEWFHLIWCPMPFSLEQVDVSDAARPKVANDCSIDTFRVAR